MQHLRFPTVRWLLVTALLVGAVASPAAAQTCERTLTANVVALDQVFFWNRLGAVQPQGMMYALANDVYPNSVSSNFENTSNSCAVQSCTAGDVHLRTKKRARPLVLRMNVGDCLRIHFRNLLDPVRVDQQQVATRDASIHAIGLQPVESILSDGSNVGANGAAGNGVVAPGGTINYVLYAEREGQHVFYSTGASTTGEGDGGTLNAGLFGAINVEPRGSVWYRSQVTKQDLALATTAELASGHPKLDYTTFYPGGNRRAGLPVLAMLQGNEIVHGDINAIIAGNFAEEYPANPVYPNRNQPFREFTVLYHDEIGAVQAFPEFFEDTVFEYTLHGVRDAFAFNYGTGGIGAEIIANRLGIGPMLDCTGCKYEEFFLSAWVVGDPAQIVDLPANVSDPANGLRATKVFYPEDPSNVHHSYLRDHVKFRVLHAGAKEHHIHHLHAHQWLYSPDSDESSYLDSQAIGPGDSFTHEIAYNGSGNRNQTVGDSIFHCHFYPHFAQGMWAMWRVHDVFEDGSRKLPDGEILAGTPIPGLVPLPGLGMAPMPASTVTIVPDPQLPNLGGQIQINGKFFRQMTNADVATTGNPGYPFFVPAIAGHRPPHPPLDTIDDGGLPRHVLTKGETVHVETRLDFTKVVEVAAARELDEQGEPIEKVAMGFHETRNHPTYTPEGLLSNFVTNGLPRTAGAPFADPCIDDNGGAIGGPRNEKGGVDAARTYKAANIQLDVIFNKEGWHFPQQRIITLWGDVDQTLAGTRPPEPFFFRANSGECLEYWHTNLVPGNYELDDFQVRTPTDILGQHIHLVKFDVTASDGAGNGFNYEDGTFSPDEVRERIHAIRAYNSCLGDEVNGGDPRDNTFECPVAQPHPYAPFQRPEWIGAQTTVQRWYADPVLNLNGNDRTLRTVFTHDHYGPSTHQQAGLYAGLVLEPNGSTWRDPETGTPFGSRFDGGPTSWRADILTGDEKGSYREFLLEFADFQLAYTKNSHPDLPYGKGPTFALPWHGVARQPGDGYDRPADAVNPPGKREVGLPYLLERPRTCPVADQGPFSPIVPLPCPEAISADDPGTMVVNYRNEPLALRVRNPNTNTQAAGDAGDLALAFSTDPVRADTDFNIQPGFYPPLTDDLHPRDPWTPQLQAYEHDKVQIRVMVGAHEEGHNLAINGIKWQFEPSWDKSGFKASQMMGISEHFEFELPQLPRNAIGSQHDYLWTAGASSDDLWNGLWGLFRVFRGNASDLLKLPNNAAGGKPEAPGQAGLFDGVCPKTAPVRTFEVVASTAAQLLPGGTLVYNQRGGVNGEGPLEDPTAILYVLASDISPYSGQLKAGVPIEPLILRANAGECIDVTLTNQIAGLTELDGFNTLPMIVDNFNTNQIRPSDKAGLHPQLVFYDVTRSDGNNVGLNPIQTANPGGSVTYRWFAGDLYLDDAGIFQIREIEYGATNLMPADRLEQPGAGAIGALIIEPPGSSWVTDDQLSTCGQPGSPRCSRAAATVFPGAGSTQAEPKPFREFVLLFQDDLNLRCKNCGSDPADLGAIPNLAEAEDPEDSGQKALNYRTEPMWFRTGWAPDATLGFTGDQVITNILTDAQVGGDPETPIFYANANQDVRFRVLDPGGHARNHVFQVHGHVWQREPYTDGSLLIGENKNSLGQWLTMFEGARTGHGPANHFDVVLQHGAGGAFGIEGDYLFRDQSSFLFDGGLWGLLRVDNTIAFPTSPADIGGIDGGGFGGTSP